MVPGSVLPVGRSVACRMEEGDPATPAEDQRLPPVGKDREMSDRFVGLIRGDVEVWAAGLDTARANLSKPDACVRAQSPFDRCARVGLPQLGFDVGQDQYLAFLTTQVLPWSDADALALEHIVASLRPVFEALPQTLPKEVWLIQTTGREEAGAAYTKHEDTIVLPANMVASVHSVDAGGDPLHGAVSDGLLAGVITHEYFHLLSKNNPKLRKQWYATVSYQELPNKIELPHTKWWTKDGKSMPMADLKITNPDAPLINVAIELPPSPGQSAVLMAPALVSSEPYSGGAFFDTLQWLFLEVDIRDGKAVLRTDDDGAPIYHMASDLMPPYREKVGYFLSDELFHPDELLAQSFAKAASQFQPPLLERIASAIWPNWPR